jgi:hypothetical protein
MAEKYVLDPRWADHVRKLVDEAPPLSPAQRSRLAALLNAARAVPKAEIGDDDEAAAQ